MHPLVLSELKNRSTRFLLNRIATPRPVTILQAFDPRRSDPGWIAKASADPLGMDLIEREYRALAYLAPWADRLGIPRILAWADEPGRKCMIREAVSGSTDPIAIPVTAGAATLDRRYRPGLDWLARFQAIVPPPSPVPIGQLCHRLLDSLQAYARDPVLALLAGFLRRHASSFAAKPAIAVHGDFFPRNVLVNDTHVNVIDWDHFGPGFPLQDLWNYFTASDLADSRGIIRTVEENCLAVGFSTLPVSAYMARQVERTGLTAAEARFYFYCVAAHQLTAGSPFETHSWRNILSKLAALDFPAPGGHLPAAEA